ncbi:MAG: phosphoribosylamine--glycine ligase [Verrucomicrobiales bacterium]
MKILVVGKGGREHALLSALSESPTRAELFSFPGSDAIFSTVAQPAPGVKDLATLIDFAKRERMDLVIAGEESCLVSGEGLANLCAREGIPCWGPPKESAQLEASKEFAKQFLVRHGIPTPRYSAASTLAEAESALTELPVVLKFDGLAAGKGVAVCQTRAEARRFLDSVFVENQFGAGRVLIEECLSGPEISIFASVVDGACHILCPARDYKRVFDGDRGPNTGGMGAVASRSIVSGALLREIERAIVVPTVAGLKSDALPYRGFLYFGLMLTEEGPKVLEFNCRFGDPECEAVMPLCSGDLVAYVWHGAQGDLRPNLIHFNEGWSVCVILASAGYPQSSRAGDVISGLDAVRGARVYHCGTRRNAEGQFETNGGRVLAIVAKAASLAEATATAHSEGKKITFPDSQRRTDIGRLHFE